MLPLDATLPQMEAIKLPPNPTPDQVTRAEPLLVQAILEDEESGYRDGIRPIKIAAGDEPEQDEYVRTGPGEYRGIFTDRGGEARFEFKITSGFITYSPLNPEAIEDGAGEG